MSQANALAMKYGDEDQRGIKRVETARTNLMRNGVDDDATTNIMTGAGPSGNLQSEKP